MSTITLGSIISSTGNNCYLYEVYEFDPKTDIGRIRTFAKRSIKNHDDIWRKETKKEITTFDNYHRIIVDSDLKPFTGIIEGEEYFEGFAIGYLDEVQRIMLNMGYQLHKL